MTEFYSWVSKRVHTSYFWLPSLTLRDEVLIVRRLSLLVIHLWMQNWAVFIKMLRIGTGKKRPAHLLMQQTQLRLMFLFYFYLFLSSPNLLNLLYSFSRTVLGLGAHENAGCRNVFTLILCVVLMCLIHSCLIDGIFKDLVVVLKASGVFWHWKISRSLIYADQKQQLFMEKVCLHLELVKMEKKIHFGSTESFFCSSGFIHTQWYISLHLYWHLLTFLIIQWFCS